MAEKEKEKEKETLFHRSKAQPQKPQHNPPPPPPAFFSSFLYKALFVCVFVALLPLFPSQAPEFVNQTIFTRSWELLHLLFVGIALSYGLFSRRNADPEVDKEAAHPKADTPQSYVSRILQVSSVFDEDEPEAPPDDGKIEAWSSQYQREEPVVMVANGRSEGSSKPLFLPVRSLRSPAQADGAEEEAPLAPNRVEEFENTATLPPTVVLPSPIPWRSRSGRMEASLPSNTLPPSAVTADSGPSRVPSFRSSSSSSAPRSASSTPSPKRPSPSPSLSPELRAKTSEDSGKKKGFYSPPPAPPPPPLPLGHASHYKTDVRRSFKDELEDLSRRGREGFLRSTYPSSPSRSSEAMPVGRSVRTVRSKEVQSPPLPRKQAEMKDEPVEKVVITSDDSESDDDDDSSEGSDVEEEASVPAAEAAAEENEVDKKADEFIAKFREQIRLQRIESIKKSSGQRSTRNSK